MAPISTEFASVVTLDSTFGSSSTQPGPLPFAGPSAAAESHPLKGLQIPGVGDSRILLARPGKFGVVRWPPVKIDSFHSLEKLHESCSGYRNVHREAQAVTVHSVGF